MVIMACLLIPGAFAASATADHTNDKGYGGIGPIVNFTVDHSSIAAGDSVKFTDTSYDNITSRSWDFGDGSISLDANPTHTYTTAGTYVVALNVQNATGYASNTSGMTVHGYTLPSITVAAIQDVSPQFNIGLNGNTYGVFGAAGSASTFSNATVNVGDALTFTDASTSAPTTWSWNFGDASALITTQNTTHTYTQAGTYVVYLTAGNVNGQKISQSLTITVAGGISPVSAFTASNNGDEINSVAGTPDYAHAVILNGTAPMTVSFTDKSTKVPSAWSWTNNGTVFSTEQNPSLTLNQGQYQIVLNASNAQGGNLSSIWVNVAGPSTPVANFTATPSTGTAPLSVQFNDTSAGGLAAPTSWLWNFGDGTQGSTVQNATHTFTAAGTYTVTLQTRNGAGVSTPVTGTVTVNSPTTPSADFKINDSAAANYAQNPVSILVGQPVYFNDTSSGSPSSYNWIFSDGQPVQAQANVTRSFSVPGTFWVYHTVTNAAGSDAKLNLFTVRDVPVTTAPVASFTSSKTSGEAPLLVNFTNTSTGTPTTFQWLINGQQVGTTADLSYTFTTPGTYSVVLIASNAGGSSAAPAQTITVSGVSAVPNANFTFTSPSFAAPSQVQFTYAGGNATQFLWTFDDGATSTEMNPAHTYQNAGTYSVRLTTTNAKGTNYKINDVVITPLGNPVASFNASTTAVTKASAASAQVSGQSPFTVVFNDTSSERPSAWYWNLGDGTTSTSQNITHTYTTPGKYAVYLVVANSLGASDYVYAPTLINVSAPSPVTDFSATPSTGAAPLNVQFTDLSGNNPFAWAWNFGDGSISGAQNPSHTYTTAGNYTVTLTTQNSVGTSTKSKVVSVISLSKPVSNFTFAPAAGQAPLTVQFTDTSLNTPSSWSWTFTDDFSTSNVQNPSHTFASAGTYGVLLTASNAAGAGEMKLQTITVSPAPVVTPVADFTATPTTGVAPLSVQFADKSTNADVWVWTFGDGATSTLQNPPAHTYTAAGTYTVQLQAVNSTSSKSNTASKTITVTPAPQTLQAAFNVNSQTVQLGTAVTGTDASTGYPAAWSWDFGDGFTASSQNINHIYSAVGNYTLSLTVTNGTQTSTASKTITVSTVPTTTTTTVTPTQGQPYNGPHNVPGTVQAEDYDLGGNNVAYYDTTAGNAGGKYRNDDVDIEIEDTPSGYDVGYIISGEYLTYSVEAAAAGDYPVTLRAANPDATAKSVTVSTGSSSTTVSVASTGSFASYNSFTSAGTLHLEQGRNVVKVAFGASRLNFDYFTIGGGVTPTTTVTTQPTTGAASFTVSPTSGRHSLSVALADTTTGGNPVSWKWNCGNGQNFSGQNIGLNRIWYNNAGTYTITLTVTDANGSTRTATQTVTVS
jgi:PKD repeat protein